MAAALTLCLLLGGCAGAPATGPDAPAPAPVPAPATDDHPAPKPQPGIPPEEARELPPLPPARVRVEPAAGRVTVQWQGTGSPAAFYAVCRRAGANENWQTVARVPAATSDAGTY